MPWCCPHPNLGRRLRRHARAKAGPYPVPYSKTFFMVDRDHRRGMAHEFGKAFEGWLNQKNPFARKSLHC